MNKLCILTAAVAALLVVLVDSRSLADISNGELHQEPHIISRRGAGISTADILGLFSDDLSKTLSGLLKQGPLLPVAVVIIFGITLLGSVVTLLSTLLTPLGIILKGVLSALSVLLSSIGFLLSTIFNIVYPVISTLFTILGRISTILNNVPEIFATVLGSIANFLSEVVSTLLTTLVTILSIILKIVITLLSTLITILGTILSAILNGVFGIFSVIPSLLQVLVSLGRHLVEKITGTTSSERFCIPT